MTSVVRRARRRLSRPVRDDSGFSLLEAVVALMVATVAFTALAAGAISAIRGSLVARQSQQAADFMGRRMEELRLVDFGGLANRPSDLPGGDSAVTTCGAYKCVDLGGTLGEEKIYTDAGGAIDDHVTEVSGNTANRTTFTLRTYVTAPDWTQRDYFRRLTVIVSWQDGSTLRERRDSTIVTYTQRGLPTPVFKLNPSGPTAKSVNPSAVVSYGFTVTNQGAPDRFDLVEDDTAHLPADPYDWKWFFDAGDGFYDPAVDTTEVIDTDGNGTRDTGKIDPTAVVKIWLVRTVAPSEPAGVQNVTITATSRSQPTVAGGVQTLPLATTVVFGTVTATPTPSSTPSTAPATDCTPASTATGTADSGYTLRAYTLHNDATPGNTTAQQSLAMAVTAPYANTLYEYSTDVMANQPGRVLLPGGTAFPATGATDPQKVADWRFPVGAKAYSGTVAVNLWVAPPAGFTASSVNLTAYVYKYTKTGSTYGSTALTTVPLLISVFSCNGFQQVGGTGTISVPTSGSGSLGPNDWIGLRVVNSGASSLRIAYDVMSLYPAAVALPEK
ncbi:MAG TPA: hypothetical protein VFK52_11715 [Nocardioidaceae bacterium]|nr:hypothetical protein [Nocardioidaceae bacterium]